MHNLEKQHGSKLKELDDEKAEAKRSYELMDAHTKVVEYLFDIIETAVTKALKDSLKFEVYKDITRFNPSFKSKENFKVKILEILLGKKFDEYELYFTEPEKCFKKWKSYFVKGHCFTIDHSSKVKKFHHLMDRKLKKTPCICTNGNYRD